MIVVSTTLVSEWIWAGTQNNPIVSIDNKLALPGVVVNQGGATAARLADGQTWTYWTPPGNTANVEFQFPTAQTITLCAVASHNLGTLRKGIRPQYWDGTAWVNAGQAAVEPTDNSPIMWAFQPITAQRWRFDVFDTVSPSTGSGIAIAVAHIGRFYQFDSRFYEGYEEVRSSNRVDLLVNESRSHKLGVSVISRGRALEWSLEHLTEESLYGSDFALFREAYDTGQGFFAAWRPTDYETCYYAWRAGDPIRIINSGPGRLKSLSLAMSAFGDE